MSQSAPDTQAISLVLAQLDTHGIAACYIDAAERLQLWNQAYLRFFPEHIGIVHAGWPYMDNLRHYFTTNHSHATSPQQLEDMIATSVMRHHTQTGPLDFQKLDGRWVRSQVNRFDDGSMVKTWADVTAEVLHSESSVIEALSTLQQALLCYDQEGRFRFANNRASSFFPALISRFRPDSGFADHLRHLSAETEASEDRDILRQLAARSWPADSGPYQPLLVNMRGGRVVQLEMTPTRDGGLTAVWTDMTEAHRLLAERSRAEAEATAKSEFLAVMSHEIRTPLNGVLGAIGLLDRVTLAPRDRDLLDTARGSAEHLLHLLNDILDFSKLEAGRVELEEVDFDLRRLVEGLAASLRSRVAEKGLQLDWKVAPELPAILRGDPGRLRQVLLNLLGNAIKFTERGWVRLEVGLDPASGKLQFSVADSGIGIAPEVRPLLFRHFTQGDRSITRRYGGTGLGLAICGQLAALMQGEITVESELGQGSVFRFSLPIHAGAAAPAQPSTQPLVEMARRGASLRILVAEDNPTNQLILSTMLHELGHQVAIADNGLEACARLRQDRFDIVLMDMQMPEMDGMAASRTIRAMAEPYASVPIIAITANALAGDRERCLAAGMDGYITKPIDLPLLIQAMDQALHRRPAAVARAVAPSLGADLTPAAAKALGALADKLKLTGAAR